MDVVQFAAECQECNYEPQDGHEAKFVGRLTIEYTCDECGYISTEYLQEDYFD